MPACAQSSLPEVTWELIKNPSDACSILNLKDLREGRVGRFNSSFPCWAHRTPITLPNRCVIGGFYYRSARKREFQRVFPSRMRPAHNHHFRQALFLLQCCRLDVLSTSSSLISDITYKMGLITNKCLPHDTKRYSNDVFTFEQTLLSVLFMRNRLCFILTSHETKWPTRSTILTSSTVLDASKFMMKSTLLKWHKS